MSILINRQQINTNNKRLVGNKAFNLAFLTQHGVKTPDFFVISPSVFENRSLSRILENEIIEYVDKLETDKFAVRSSATCEDGKNSSFAGQFESYLGISRTQLLNAVIKCWRSAFSSSVETYCTYHEIKRDQIKMAVIVQKMINADKGGVIFTKNIFQKNDDIIIEAARGLGENIVSGLVDPERIILPRRGKNQSFKPEVLNAKELETLFNEGLRIEKLYDAPQDIEWAIENDELFILQTRPIT
jgi:pyruvate,water dikinase